MHNSVIPAFLAELNSITAFSNEYSPNNISPLVANNTGLAVVYNVRGGVRESYTKDSFGLNETFIELNLYHHDYPTLVEIREAIFDTFEGFTGSMGSTTENILVTSSKFSNSRELVDQEDQTLYRFILELQILT